MYEDACGSTLPDDVRLGTTGGEGTSEGGSESSSIAGSVSVRTSRMNVKRTATASNAAKKKITSGTESQKSTRAKPTNTTSNMSLGTTTPRSKSRTATPRNIMAKTQGASRERDHRPRSKEKLSVRESSSSLVADVTKTPVGSRSTATYACRSSSSVASNLVSTPTSSSIARTRTRALPDTLPSALTTEINKDLAQRSGRIVRNDSSRSRTASSTRGARTPASTPSEETRMKVPSTPRALCAKSTVSRADNKTAGQDKALDTYATLPRRNRTKLTISKAAEKLDKTIRSRSGSRDVSLSRIVEKKSVIGKDSSSVHKSLPPYPRQRVVEKTRIYHETSAQTGLTGQDIENAMSGQPNVIAGPEVIERLHKSCQTEDAWNDVQTLQDNLRRLNEETSNLQEENEKLKLELAEANRLLKEERADHAFARQELDRNAQRVLAMLGTPQSEHAGNLMNNRTNDNFSHNARLLYIIFIST